jgi:hypothetical protein
MWIHNDIPLDEIPEGYLAFVYLITNLTNGKKYVGKKLFRFTRSRKTKGKRVKKTVDSDWKSYYGSNKELQADVEQLGSEQFRREVLHLCKSKGEASYLEAKEQFLRDVLMSEEYYNAWISCKIAKNHLTKV